MFRKKKAIGGFLLAFAVGSFVATFLPVSALAFVEGLLLLCAGWCFLAS